MLTIFVLSIAVFAISEVAPGNLAINTLGVFITPEQEASFNAQFGLDDPAATRYLRWLIGSDYQASRLLGHPLVRLRDETGRISWWAVAVDNTLYKNFVDSERRIWRIERLPDGQLRERQRDADQWAVDGDGLHYFWGVTSDDQLAMWVRGQTGAALLYRNQIWSTVANAPVDYLPLQRGILRGDPGVSMKSSQPISVTLVRRLTNSLILAGISFVLIMPLSLLLGLLAGLNEGNVFDRMLSFTGIVASVTPQFVSGVFLILIFASWLEWLPGATVLYRGDTLLNQPELLVLPVLTLTLAELGYILRITRASTVDVMGQNYIRTAVLKGLPTTRIIWRHALPNALLAPLTVMMLHVNWLIGGLVVVEVIFGFPGLGRYLLEAALDKDVFALEAGAMLLLVIATSTQLIADICYIYLNPRIRYT